MCTIEDEQDRLLKRGGHLELEGSPKDASHDPSKERRRAPFSSKHGLLIFALVASVSFVAGYFLSGDAPAPRADEMRAAPLVSLEADAPNNHGGKLPLVNASFAEYLVSGMKKMLALNNGTKYHYKYPSPYELRWPRAVQPKWSRKWIPYNKRLEGDKQICFVHVGKAGGSTLGCMLGFSLHCRDENDIKGLLPIVTTHALHRGIDDCHDSPAPAYYLFVVRDPLARILSDMNYERPNMTKADALDSDWKIEKLYVECDFWTLESLAQKGLLNKEKNRKSQLCGSRAFGAITGAGEYLVHSYFNYQYYTQLVFRTEGIRDASTVPENVDNLLVIRNEHMLDDYNKINELIGGRPGALKPSDIPLDNAHTKTPEQIYLSDSSKVALCEALCHEIQVYKDIIKRAVNLDQNAVSESMDELRQKCPKEATENQCLGGRPDMRERVQDSGRDKR
ncbi:hypothetical protein ACHAWF_016488 [Thalassiosira exigua]